MLMFLQKFLNKLKQTTILLSRFGPLRHPFDELPMKQAPLFKFSRIHFSCLFQISLIGVVIG